MRGFAHALIVSRAPAACYAAMGVVWGSFMALMPDLQALLAVDDGALGVLLIWGSVAAIAMMLLAPRIGTAMGRAALPGFALAMAGALVLMGLTAGPVGFVLALMTMGMSSGALDVFQNARLAAIEAREGVPLMNLSHALYSLAFALAAVLTGAARAAGWDVAPILWTAASVVLVLAVLAWERDGGIDGLGRRKAGEARMRLGAVPVLGGLLILAGLMSENAVEAWSALFIERDLGGAVGAGSLAPALMALTMGLGRLGGQAVAARLPERVLLRAGLGVSGLGILTVAAAQSVGMAYVGFVVMGLGASVVVPTALGAIGRLSTPQTRSRAIARATILGYVGYFIGPPLLGLVAELAGLRLSFLMIAVVVLAALAAAEALTRR